jgi:hypothetical protein
MSKQYLRKKPFWSAYLPIPWWISLGVIILGLLIFRGMIFQNIR